MSEILGPMSAEGLSDISVDEIQKTVARWVKEGKTTSAWNENTTCRVTQGLMSALRDFGILQGAVHKRIAPAYLPIEAFAYVTFYLRQHQPSGAKLVEHPESRLFFLPPEGVERFLFEAHQRGLLEYHAAGSVTRLNFPAPTLEEYAHVLAQAAH
ncbi:MAG: BrxA family protein [Isosphaeraceae bacterium]